MPVAPSTIQFLWLRAGVRAVLMVLLALWGTFSAAQSIESIMAPGKLSRAHAKYEDQCIQCHVRFNRQAQDGRCLDCHKETRSDVTEHTGYHGKMKAQACNSCHSEHKGVEARLVVLDKVQFDHRLTDYQLHGKHEKVQCEKCHVPGKKFREAPGACVDCHRADDPHRGSLGPKCADCHVDASWKEVKFDHDKTRFALTGKHIDTKCAECHPKSVYKDTPRACVACHRKDDDQKGHKGNLGEKCESCHGTKLWKSATFNHDTDTKYVLRGKHAATKCADCHGVNPYRVKTSQECYTCHKKDDKHKESLGHECGSCHTEKSWKESPRFDHAKTAFPLLGRHVEVECKACHEGNMYKQASKECLACHKKDDKHNATLGTQCAECHTERDWKATRFDHDRTRFPLRRAHAAKAVTCVACHRDQQSMRNTAMDCISCHKKDDKHAGTLGSACADCHSDASWKLADGRFDHDKTRFILRNAHAKASVTCKACHTDPKSFRSTAMDCISCHKKDDKHEAQEGRRCETCHTDRNWKVERFDHNRARFVLSGRHALAECKACHQSLRFRDAKSECIDCHLRDDKHKQALGTRCSSCHNARAWAIWNFDHGTQTRFRLDGGHLKVACASCHRAAAPAGTAAAPLATNCYSCHRENDPHEGKFGLRCDQCHTTVNWKRVRAQVGSSSEGATGLWRVAQALWHRTLDDVRRTDHTP